jgi:hypothetical protein
MVKRIIDKIIQFFYFNIKKCNIVAILYSEGSLLPSTVTFGKNLVTDDGDQYYAQLGAAEATSNSYVGFRLGTGTASPTKSDTDVQTEDSAGRKAVDGGYPKTDDDDTDNSSADIDIITWRVSYTTAEANITNIAEGAIVDSITTPTSALCRWTFAASFTKTSNDTLKVFVNHRMNGV